MTKTCKYCKQIKPIDHFVKVLSWTKKCCKDCYQLPSLKKQRDKDDLAIKKRLEYRERYEKYERERKAEWHLYRNAIGRAKKYNLPFSIELSDIIIPKICPVLGIVLKKAKKRMDDFSPTLDRIVPEMGYVKKNIMVISNRANRIKSNGTIEEHKKIISYMLKHM